MAQNTEVGPPPVPRVNSLVLRGPLCPGQPVSSRAPPSMLWGPGLASHLLRMPDEFTSTPKPPSVPLFLFICPRNPSLGSSLPHVFGTAERAWAMESDTPGLRLLLRLPSCPTALHL